MKEASAASEGAGKGGLVPKAKRSEDLLLAHGALVGAVWLASSVVYGLVFAAVDPLWLAIDLALIAGAVGYVWKRLPVRIVSARGFVAIAVVSLACVLASQLRIHDANGIWLDETNYLATLHGGIQRHGMLPFNLRWLEPVLGNVMAARGADGLKAMNFGALVVTCAYLVLLLLRLRVDRRLAVAAPVFLIASYLGVYAATNRLVVDPFNYAMFVLLAHAVIGYERWLPWLLLVAACNSEKVVYWIPVIFVIQALRRQSLMVAVRAAVPALVYLAAFWLFLRGSSTAPTGTYFEQLHRMAMTPAPMKLTDPIAIGTTSQMMWFPFGAFTIYALLALRDSPKWLLGLVLLLVPVMAQTLIATDTERMTAYAFIVYLPLGALYLTRVFRDLPRLAVPLLTALVALAIAQHYVHFHHVGRLVLAAAELVLVGVIVWAHSVVKAL